jgi:hypothetical protein
LVLTEELGFIGIKEVFVVVFGDKYFDIKELILMVEDAAYTENFVTVEQQTFALEEYRSIRKFIKSNKKKRSGNFS